MNSKSKFKSNIEDLKTVKNDGHYNVIDNDMDKANALGDFSRAYIPGSLMMGLQNYQHKTHQVHLKRLHLQMMIFWKGYLK